jgi:hypothetical protein
MDPSSSDVETEPERTPSLSRYFATMPQLNRRSRRGRGANMPHLIEWALDDNEENATSPLLQVKPSEALADSMGSEAVRLILQPFSSKEDGVDEVEEGSTTDLVFSQGDSEVSSQDVATGPSSMFPGVTPSSPSSSSSFNITEDCDGRTSLDLTPRKKQRLKRSDYWCFFQDNGDKLECLLEPELYTDARNMNQSKKHPQFLQKKHNNSTCNLLRHLERYHCSLYIPTNTSPC